MKINCIIRCVLVACVVALAISLLRHPRRAPAMIVSDNGIVPVDLLQGIAHEDEILARPVAELNLDGAKLDTALQLLASASKTKIGADWHDLEGAGIGGELPVHVHLRNTTLAAALTWIADSAGGSTARLGYDIDGETVRFATIGKIEQRRTVEVYNIRDLAGRIQSHTHRLPGEPPMTRNEAIGSLTKLIADTSESERLIEPPASPAIREIGGLLVIRQTPQSQRQIATLLTRLDAELRK